MSPDGTTPATARVERLRRRMRLPAGDPSRGLAGHARHRVLLSPDWSTSHLEVSIPERKAHALKLLLERMPVFIEDEELIVGARTVLGPVREGQTRVENPSVDLSLYAYPRYLTETERAHARELFGGHVPEGCSKAHFVGGFAKALRLGFGGIRREAHERLEQETSQEKRDFLRAVCVAYEGASLLAERYARLAGDMAEDAAAPRDEELRRIAAVCLRVANEPPRDLHEALQLFWFAHLVLLIENHVLISYGRFDQLIEPFWSACPPPDAQELLDCLTIKLNDLADVGARAALVSGADNLVLSGLRPDGADATNAVTYACLDALDHTRLEGPMLAVRLHRDSPARLLGRACDLIRQGLGQIAFYNDDVFVPALVAAGLPVEAARNYVLDACQDVLIEGQSDFYLGGAVGLTETLIDTLDAMDGGADFAGLLAAYKRRIATAIETAARGYVESLSLPQFSPLPFLSGMIDDCVAKGLDLTAGGCRYRDKGMFIMSPVNAANSLAAIKRVVYDDRAATLDEVRGACRANFEHAESLRRRLLAAPKWGNDDDYVDCIAKDVIEFACHEVAKRRIDDEARFLSGIHQPHQVAVGARVGATPDGRRAGEAFPVTLAPANGTERNGPTAVVRSVTKIDPMVCQWNHALTLSFSPSALTARDADGERGEDCACGRRDAGKFEALLRAYLALGGGQLQCNVIDPDTLREAQRHPDRHAHLVVRVWGFCARFVDLTKEYQDDLIARTAHAL